ncbi:hypothetical protein A3A95_03575 [Candidatus Nomurabacteria bacterium RIFCSPLOWO2_01_FULL_39_18]|uniref:DNA polymerase III subunit delta n=1 Tax=Candidatus Nomurabacteria bacterium RIFCSPHIGHO2_01_FULL_40_24b TaxID=1801739 RepID=A0A1F6V6W8_9BACT|nr:MAG: hypothetical protein A2647_04945 [Candidatus Nomurabacteria bacterium RIFCSPHIGHO2_01_FULL_40_24b]OGI89189.1 MAG: hypothetical protein A3A95_03575 [Candidatus Nomurabacteria bacterium RIFCSPLOWO2_01_FULL_39_18]
MILKYLDKNNLHHAYLIEGSGLEIVPEILKFIRSLGIETIGNADVSHIMLDSFKIEDARNLKSYAGERGTTSGKKIFIISTNSFLLEAQNSLLKMFEEPIENTHFFLVVPDVNAFLPTFISRFYLIKPEAESSRELEEAEKFISMPLKARIDFIKELLTEAEEQDEEGNEITTLDSARSRALNFLNAVESTLHKKTMSKTVFDIDSFEQIFKVREFLRMPGSSTKTLMESVALAIPVL